MKQSKWSILYNGCLGEINDKVQMFPSKFNSQKMFKAKKAKEKMSK